jgi:hypothetical protein
MALGRFPAMRNRGAKRIIADKRTSVADLVGDLAGLTCAQPVNECKRRQAHVEGVCDTHTSGRSNRAWNN